MTDIRLRQATKEDIPFLANSWLKSYRDAYAVKGCPNTLYYQFQHKVIDWALSESAVLVLCDPEDEWLILGWLAYQRLSGGVIAIHYLYVKHPFRKQGLAKRMVEQVIEAETDAVGPPAVMFTHKTKGGRAIQLHYERKARAMGDPDQDFTKNWQYHPYLPFMLMPEDWARGEYK